MHLTIIDNPDHADVVHLESCIDAFNVARTGITDVRQLAIFVRGDDRRMIAGLHGWTWGLTCEIRTLWIDESSRGRGLGTRLMAAAEAEARERGARQIVLSTHSFQAPAFYRKLGFEIVGQVDEYPRGHASYYLRKRL